MSKSFFTAILGSFLLFEVAVSQEISFRFSHLTPADGLASTTVAGITQDSFGFIWIGSQDGISRFDGRNFKHFRPNPADTLSLTSLDAQYLTADRQGGVWITITDYGLNYYDPHLEGFRHYGPEQGLPKDQRYTVVSVDHQNRVWAATDSSVYLLDEDTGRFYRDEGQQDGIVYRMAAHNNGELLFFQQSYDGAVFIGRRDEQGEYSYEPVTRTLNPSGRHPYRMHLIKDSDGNEWFVNQDHAAKKTENEESWQFITPQNQNCLANLREAVIDSQGYLWAKTTDLLCRMNLDSAETSVFRHNPEDPASILPIRSGGDSRIFIDRQEILWVAHYASGISRTDLYSGGFNLYNMQNRLPTNDVISVLEASNETFWVGVRMLGNSLIHFNKNGSVINRYGSSRFDAPAGRTVDNQLSHPHAFALAESQDGSIWVGTGSSTTIFGGLNRIRPGSTSITRFKNDADDPGSLPNNNIEALAADGSDRIWILSSSEDLHWINPANEQFTRHELPDTNTISSSSNQFLYADSSGNLWIKKSGHKNLYHLRHETLEINTLKIHFSDEDSPEDLMGEINAIHEDVDGQFWAGTNVGFGQFHPETGRVLRWFSDGDLMLPTNEIAGIQSDDNGFLWLSTIYGIVKFNPDNHEITHFGFDRGLQGNIFSSNVSFRGQSGSIYFGGAGGLNILRPEQITTNPFPPDVVFTNLHVDGRAVEPGDDAPITESLLIADQIVIDPSVTTLTIDFAALHFASPHRNEYRYILEGFDSEWLYGGTAGSATYTNLAPGEYTFRLMASNRDGIWSEGDDLIKIITVLPPWYRTWWAYTIYALIFVLGVFAVDRFQRRRLIRREREKARERELEQAREIEKAYNNLEKAHQNLKEAQDQLVQQEKLASLGQLTAGIAHEIKNPLNFVNNFSEVSLELVEEAREEVRQETEDGGPESGKGKTPLLSGDGIAESDARCVSSEAQNSNLILQILDDIETNLRKIHEHGSRANNIVQSMLMHSRTGSGKLEQSDLNKVVKESANLVFHGLKASGKPNNAEIEYELDISIGKVPLIAEDMSRVILNLCNNAFDAMMEKEKTEENGSGYKPKLTVRTKKHKRKIIIEIEDNGPGIPDKIKDKILQPFFTTKKGTQGTGLGLSITHDIIKLHGGFLNIKSQPGKTVFRIQLPE